MKKMQHKKKAYATAIMAFLTFSIFLASIPMTKAAGAITLTPTTQAPGGSVSVGGTSFGVTKAVGIGCGAEVVVTSEVHNIPSPSGTGPFTAIMNHYPIKPGSFSFHCTVSSDTNVVESDYTDNGDGTLTSSSTYALNPFVNYVTGAFGRSTSSAWDGYTVVFTASYTYYQYNVTPAAGVNSTAAGAFTASITVPAVAAGTYNVTAFDTQGNRAVAPLTVTTVIPEVLPLGIILLLSLAAVVVGSRYLGKKPKVQNRS